MLPPFSVYVHVKYTHVLITLHDPENTAVILCLLPMYPRQGLVTQSHITYFENGIGFLKYLVQWSECQEHQEHHKKANKTTIRIDNC